MGEKKKMADLNFKGIEKEIINKIGRDLTPSEETLIETGIGIFLRDLTISQATADSLGINNNRAMIEDKTGKGRFDLLPPRAITRLAKRFEMGASKYGDRDWEKGIPIPSLTSSALRHMFKYLKGDADEDHLIAAVWNLMAIAEQEELIKEKEN